MSKYFGTWQSSKEMSLEYNNKSSRLTPSQSEFLEQIFGFLKLTYIDKSIHEHETPTIIVTINSKEYNFHFEDSIYKYETLSCTKNALKIKSYYLYEAPLILKINFINDNTYWVSPQNLPNSREYFIRVLS